MIAQRQYLENGVQQVVQAASVFSGDRKQLADSKTMKLIREALLLLGINLVDGEKQRLAGADQLARQFDIRRGHFGAAVHHHDDGVGFLERDLGLAENFRRDEVFVFGENAAGIHDAQVASAPFRLAIETVARDAGFVADNGAPRAHQPIEKRGFADVGAPHDGDGGNAGRNRRRTQSWMGHKIRPCGADTPVRRL